VHLPHLLRKQRVSRRSWRTLSLSFQICLWVLFLTSWWSQCLLQLVSWVKPPGRQRGRPEPLVPWRALAALPANVFAAAAPTQPRYTMLQRGAAFVVKGVELGLVGTTCGFVGQSLANTLLLARQKVAAMVGRRAAEESAEAAEVMELETPPSVIRTALVWGLFMATSANTRYQLVVGAERLLASTTSVTRIPKATNAGIVILRLMNNILGGEQFVDMGRAAGIL